MTTVTRHTDAARGPGTSVRRAGISGSEQREGRRVGVHGNTMTRSPKDGARRLVPVLAEAQRYSQE